MPTIDTQIDIDAPPSRVWQILTDFPAYPGWNPLITRVEGEPIAGTKIKERIVLPNAPNRKGRKLKATSKICTVMLHRELTWRGRLLPLPGLFTGTHHYRLDPLDGGGTRLHNGERYAGLLAPLFMRKFGDQTRAGFHHMNAALKARAETPESAAPTGR